MVLAKKPFVRYDPDFEGEGEVISVRLNQEERQMLEELKRDLNIKSDGKALKVSAFVGKNVLQQTFGTKLLRYLFKNERQKLTDFKKYD